MTNTVWKKSLRSARLTSPGMLCLWALAALVLSLTIASCRRERVWSGMKYDKSGRFLQFAAAEPFCGCLDIVNASNKPIFLRSRAVVTANNPSVMERGHVILAPNQELAERFDWAGPAVEDIFEVDAWSEDGHPLITRNVIRGVNPSWPYAPCDTHVCKMTTLYMNTGTLYQH